MVKNGCYANGGLNLAWNLGVSFVGIPNFAKTSDKKLWWRSKVVREKGVSCFHLYRFWDLNSF